MELIQRDVFDKFVDFEYDSTGNRARIETLVWRRTCNKFLPFVADNLTAKSNCNVRYKILKKDCLLYRQIDVVHIAIRSDICFVLQCFWWILIRCLLSFSILKTAIAYLLETWDIIEIEIETEIDLKRVSGIRRCFTYKWLKRDH